MGLVITLLVVGAILLLLETFLPGFVAGIAGLICIGWGVGLAYIRFGAETGDIILMIVVGGLAVGTVLWIRYLPSTPFARLFASKRAIGDINAARPELLDRVGVAHSPLRPSGVAIFDGRRVDVVTEGGMIDPGTQVKVVQVEGIRVVVRAV